MVPPCSRAGACGSSVQLGLHVCERSRCCAGQSRGHPMVPPCSSAGGCRRSAAVECIVIEVSEAREARRLALARPAVPLNIAARSPLLLLYTSSVFGRKSKLAWLPRAYRTPMMPCCRPTARGLSVAVTPRVKARPRKHRQPTAQPPCFTAALASFTACGASTMVQAALQHACFLKPIS